MVDCGLIDGKRDRKYCSTKASAQTEAKRRRDERRRGMDGALSISDSDLMDAVAAKRILAGTGITLESLAVKAIDSGARTSMSVSKLYSVYLESKRGSGIRPRSLKNIEAREGRFSTDLGSTPLSGLTAQVINQWLDQNRWLPVTRNTYLRAARAMLAYAVKNEWIGRNPALNVDFVKTSTALPFVFSVDTVEKVMEWCITKRPKSTLYYAMAFFAGIRPDEVKRITKNSVDFDEGIITVSPQASKTHMRHVDIQPNLMAWMKAYPVPKKGSVYWSRRMFRELLDDLKLDWGHDVARKSFISYHLAAFRNQNETVLQAGHRSTDMIFTVYRNITTTDGQKITRDYAAGYWAITPDSIRKKKDALHPEAKTEKGAGKSKKLKKKQPVL